MEEFPGARVVDGAAKEISTAGVVVGRIYKYLAAGVVDGATKEICTAWVVVARTNEYPAAMFVVERGVGHRMFNIVITQFSII